MLEYYLTQKMPEIGFPAADAAALADLLQKLEKSPRSGTFFDLIDKFDAREEPDYVQVRAVCAKLAADADASPYAVELLFFLCLCPATERRYREEGIPYEIFINTMRDLAYKAEECKLVRGVLGTFVGYWMPKAFTLERFALGRLQYQFSTFKAETYRKNGRFLQKGDPVLGLHIPRTGTPLDPASCNASFEMAKDFFTHRFGGNIPVTCHSWLLYPPMHPALKEGSNTARFYDLFEILFWNDNPPGEHPDMWRLFDTEHLDPATLPRNGSLRRAYAERMEAGLPTGEGYGLLWI